MLVKAKGIFIKWTIGLSGVGHHLFAIWVASASMTATLSRCVLVDKSTTSPNFLQLYKTPCCWTFCKLLGLAHCYQPFLYSTGIDICICLVSFPYDIYDKFTHHYPTSMLNSDLGFVFVFVGVVRHCLWYRASRAVISTIAYFANNTWFWSRVAISHSLLSDWIVLDLDILPSTLSQMNNVFSGATGVVNLDRDLHWLWHSFGSLCLHLLAVSSVKVQINKLCAMMLNVTLIQPRCLPHHLTGMVHRSWIDLKKLHGIFIKIVVSRASSWYLPLARHE